VISWNEKREECGVFGIYDSRKNVVDRIYYGLISLQHRGQEAAGVSIYDGSQLVTKKAVGLASENLRQEIRGLRGRVGIGHVRYSTVGTSSLANAQPFFIKRNGVTVAFAHNGNLVNFVHLRKRLKEAGVRLKSKCDAEIILQRFVSKYEATGDIFDSLADCVNEFEGAFSGVGITSRGEAFAVRDPYGFRPLCFGHTNGVAAFASESVALDINSIELKGDIQPGEALLVSDEGMERKRYASIARRAHCFFEYVYFSRPDSIIEGRSVHDVRFRLGVNLAKTHPADAEIVVPVPDTSRTAAEGFSQQSGIPVAEGLIKNRYIYRTFIMPRQRLRDLAVKLKLNPVRPVLKDRRVVLIDDSLVRGTTLKGIVSMLKRAGAKEVHVRITCPPIISPCFYGIDIATHKELIAARMEIDEIGRAIDADSLGYQTMEGLIDALGMPASDLCNACLTGVYPTPAAQNIADSMKELTLTRRVRYWEVEA